MTFNNNAWSIGPKMVKYWECTSCHREFGLERKCAAHEVMCQQTRKRKADRDLLNASRKSAKKDTWVPVFIHPNQKNDHTAKFLKAMAHRYPDIYEWKAIKWQSIYYEFQHEPEEYEPEYGDEVAVRIKYNRENHDYDEEFMYWLQNGDKGEWVFEEEGHVIGKHRKFLIDFEKETAIKNGQLKFWMEWPEE